jgi:nitrite reductase (NADH) small subunit
VYPIEVRDGQIYLVVPDKAAEQAQREPAAAPPTAGSPGLKPNEFRIGDIAVGQIRLVHVGGEEAAVYNAEGAFYATQGACTHRGGPLSEGDLAGHVVTCPLHGSQFDVTTGQVVQGPAEESLMCYRVIVDGEIGRVDPIA